MDEETYEEINNLREWVAGEILKLRAEIDAIKDKMKEKELFGNRQ